MNYRNLNKKEYNRAIIAMIEELGKPLNTAGKHRRIDWLKGWKKDGKYPAYFGKHPVNRFKGRLVMALSKDYERDALYSILDLVFKKYLWNCKHVYEFGCGTGHNLKRLNKKSIVHGLDWANPKYPYFDFFNPKGNIEPNSGVYTVAALEQTGIRYKKFVKYLLLKNPCIVLHVEPIEELLDPTNLLDYLSLRYFKKRRYLSGYLTYLRKLQKEGKIKIHTARRSGIGSMFIEGYSIIAWSPN